MSYDFNNPGLASLLARGWAGEVNKAFEQFSSRLAAPKSFIESHASHRESIESCLKTNFGMTSFFRSGSYGNATNVKNFSDVDYFAVIPTANLHQDSSYTLARLADALRATFSQTAGIRVDNPGVKIPFAGAKELVEIIPADEIGASPIGHRLFEIPDGNGRWIRSSPPSHNAYVDSIDGRLSNKVKPLIRFIKAWKFLRNVPIRSFYLEMFVAEYASHEAAIVYDIDISRVFRFLRERSLPSIPDPLNLSGTLAPCSSFSDWSDAYSKLLRAAGWAEEAFQLAYAQRISDAFDRWSLVYDGRFPLYVKDS